MVNVASCHSDILVLGDDSVASAAEEHAYHEEVKETLADLMITHFVY